MQNVDAIIKPMSLMYLLAGVSELVQSCRIICVSVSDCLTRVWGSGVTFYIKFRQSNFGTTKYNSNGFLY
jgi:hypothetical protein